MIAIKTTLEEQEKLKELQQSHKNYSVRKKALVILLKSHEMTHSKIVQITGLTENTIRSYLKTYLKDGISAITTTKPNQPQSSLEPFRDMILKYADETPPSTINQACSEIAVITGITLKKTAMRDYLKSLKIRPRKTYGIPAKADPEKQEQFLNDELLPRLKEAEDKKREVFFVDAAHFVWGAFFGILWSLVRKVVKVPAGRKRFNVLGALNAITKELITVTNETYITAVQVCELIDIIATKTKIPATLVMDNARYQRCRMVMEHAEKRGIELLFLPSYSPNLNLIERIWKFVKKKCLNSQYHPTFESFKQSISCLLETMHLQQKDALKTLLTLKFQLFTENKKPPAKKASLGPMSYLKNNHVTENKQNM